MVEEKYIELINKEIDGVNSPKEAARLKEYLARNPEAQNLYNNLVALANRLKHVKEIEPSPNLKRNVLSSIQLNRYATKEKKYAWSGIRDFVQALFGVPSYKVNFKYAYVFALGLMAGVLIFSLLSDTSHQPAAIDNSDLYGAIILRGTSGSFKDADQVEINLDKVSGAINTKYSQGLVLAELSFKTEQEIELVFEFDENELSFGAFTRLNNQASISVQVNENSLKLMNFGENKYLIVFAKKTQAVAPLKFKIFSDGVSVYEKTISTVGSQK